MGKLPPPTTLGATLGAFDLAVPFAAGPPICKLVGPSLSDAVNAAEVAAEHPLNTENGQEHNHPLAPVSRQQRAAGFAWCQTAARWSVPADCVARS